MTERRFYVAPADVAAAHLTLREDEAHHARRVLRLRAGAAVTCFDGEGRGWHGRIDRYSGDLAFVTVECTVAPEPVLRPALTLAQSIVKGDRMDVIVQKATELGVNRVIPVAADRCDVRMEADRTARRAQRWRRIAVEAARQSERLSVPAIGEPVGLQRLISEARCPVLALVEREARPVREVLETIGSPDELVIAIGPEGGWSEEERRYFASSNVPCVSLGAGILRTETAAIAGISIVRYALSNRA